MSDEASLATNFQSGAISGPEYQRRLARLRGSDDTPPSCLVCNGHGRMLTETGSVRCRTCGGKGYLP